MPPARRTPLALAPRVLAAVAVLVAALATVGPAATAEASDTGHLTWGVKTSFRTYVTGPIAHGAIETSGGATTDADGLFRFPSQDLGTVGGASASARYSGTVHFTGHDGALDLSVSNPRIEIGDGTGTLVVDVASIPIDAPEDSTPVVEQDVALATLELGDITPTAVSGGRQWSDVPTTLTAEGAPAFGGFYEPGEALDPVTFVVPLDTSTDDSDDADLDSLEDVAAGLDGVVLAVAEDDEVPTEVLATTETGDFTVTGGSIDWGLRASFRNYIVGPIANGSIDLEGGASTNADGTFRFPVAAGGQAELGGAVQVAASGTVHFRGHDGELEITIANPRVQTDGRTGTLFADVTSLPIDGGAAQDFPGVALADLDLSGIDPSAADGGWALANVPAQLSADGVEAFAGFYVSGEPLDALTLTLRVEESDRLSPLPDAPPPPVPSGSASGPPAASGPGGSLPRTGDGPDQDLIVLGMLLVALGIGVAATVKAAERVLQTSHRARP